MLTIFKNVSLGLDLGCSWVEIPRALGDFSALTRPQIFLSFRQCKGTKNNPDYQIFLQLFSMFFKVFLPSAICPENLAIFHSFNLS